MFKATIVVLIDTIAEENAGFAAKCQIVWRVKIEPWKASTSIGFKKCIVRLAMK